MYPSPRFHHSLVVKLIFWVWVILFISFGAWFSLHLKYDKKTSVEITITGVDRLGQAVVLSIGQAMTLNARKDVTPMLIRLAKQRGIRGIRIYSKQGNIKYSNRPEEIGHRTNIEAEACNVCHRSDPPLSDVSLQRRTREFRGPGGTRSLGVISPIYNEKSCGIKGCHDSQSGKTMLGALDIIVSLEQIDRQSVQHKKAILAFALGILVVTGAVLALFIMRFVRRPIEKLISGTRHIAEGDYGYPIEAEREDEIGRLARAISDMGRQTGEKQEEINGQKEAYQNLFEHAPCYITVQDKDFKLLAFNREFAEHFDPKPGDYCYRAYKGRSERCEICPVAETFEDGKHHTSEETGINKDGTRSFWMVRTAPLRDSQGRVTSAMEMSLDVTKMKFLENEVRKSEEKYRAIFNSIPNPVFLLGEQDLRIIDCNPSVEDVYGFAKEEVLGKSFGDLFEQGERGQYEEALKARQNFNKMKQLRKDGKTIYVNMRVSRSGESPTTALLVTVSDITEQLIAEQQLVQASKMATLGEMATGIAHELNQPLSVIKTASNLILKKVRRKEPIKEEIMETLAEEMDSHVDRASKIINHLREFGRQAEVKSQEVQVNVAINNALEIFSQQLKLRGIEVVLDIEKDLPCIMADSNRLEQVFINLLTNARDAIEERQEHAGSGDVPKQIRIRTRASNGSVVIELTDTGCGIPDRIRDRIFDPFFTTKKVGKGTGLGLAISYGIVRDYKGTIEVKSSVNEGSSFLIKFPIPGRSK